MCHEDIIESFTNLAHFEVAVPENGGETQDLTVYDFEGAGGVALTMYNTDEVF